MYTFHQLISFTFCRHHLIIICVLLNTLFTIFSATFTPVCLYISLEYAANLAWKATNRKRPTHHSSISHYRILRFFVFKNSPIAPLASTNQIALKKRRRLGSSLSPSLAWYPRGTLTELFRTKSAESRYQSYCTTVITSVAAPAFRPAALLFTKNFDQSRIK